MKAIYIAAEALAKDAQALVKKLAKFNPGIDNDDQASLETLAADAGTLAYQFATLRVDIIRKHEERQRDGI